MKFLVNDIPSWTISIQFLDIPTEINNQSFLLFRLATYSIHTFLIIISIARLADEIWFFRKDRTPWFSDYMHRLSIFIIFTIKIPYIKLKKIPKTEQ